MRQSFYATLATAALGVAAVQAGASTITIDQYTTDQRVSDVPGVGLVNQSQVSDSTAIGGFRDMKVENDQGSTDGTELRVKNDRLSFSNISQGSGIGTIDYDGDDDPDSLDTNGLGGVDLTAAGTDPFFNFDVVEFDKSLKIGVEAYDIAGGSSTYTEILPAAANFSPELPFTAFTGNVDFSQVGALRFTVESTSVDLDGTLEAINVQGGSSVIAPIPLPASALFMVAGLGGFPLVRSLRRRKS